MSITLPPLPEPVNKHGFNCIQTLDQLRARDLKVARLALKAAAQTCERYAKNRLDDEAPIAYVYGAKDCAAAIRALEVRHHE